MAVTTTYTKIVGTPFALNNLANFPLSNLLDGDTNTYWFLDGTLADAYSIGYVGLSFNSPVRISQLKLGMYHWPRIINIGYSNEDTPKSVADFTLIKSIDTSVETDDTGVAFTRDTVINTVNLPDYPAAKHIGIYVDEYLLTGPISSGYVEGETKTWQSSYRISVSEFEAYTAEIEEAPPPVIRDGVNPKIPTSVKLPVLPFSATPEMWTRKVFDAPGQYTYVPAEDTTAILVFAQGGGSGGRVSLDEDGNTTELESVGQSTYVRSPDNTVNILYAVGGQRSSGGPSQADRGVNWILPYELYNGTAGASSTSGTAIAGAASQLTSGGKAYTIDGTSGLSKRLIDFTKEAGPFTIAYKSGHFKRDSKGWNTVGSGNNAGTMGRLQLRNYFVAGDVLRFDIQASGSDSHQIFFNGTLIYNRTASANGIFSYTVPYTGTYTIEFRQTQVSSAWEAFYIRSIDGVRATSNIAEVRGGSSGGAAYTLLLPQQLNLSIGRGGSGVKGMVSTVPNTAHGSLGSGGAAGADGGDGAVIIYEFKGSLLLEDDPLVPELSTFNKISGAKGFYQTNYVGVGNDTLTNHTHKVRPRTKTVFALIIGAGGGGGNTGSNYSSRWVGKSASVSGPTFSFVANGGYNSYATYYNPTNGSSYWNYYPGAAGTVGELTFSPLLASAGAYNGSSGLAGNYGLGETGSRQGGGGAYILVEISEEILNANNRILDIQVPGGGRSNYRYGNPGAVFIFESEDAFGTVVTQNPLLVLKDDGIAPNNVTQNALLVLKDDGVAVNNVTQNALLVLKDDGVAVNNVTQSSLLVLQESEMTENVVTQNSLLVLTDAGVAENNVTQNSLLVLQRSIPGPSMVSETGLQVVHEVPPVNVRVSQSLQYVIVESEPAKARVSQNLQSVLVEADDPSISVTQTAGLLLLRQNQTNIVLMDFGVIRYPFKNVLYESEVCVVDGVSSYIALQLEGYLPEGSTIIKNGVDMNSLSVNAVNGDTIQLRSGITNWFESRITLYGYTYRNDQIVREYAGYWTMLQADLSPAKRAIIGARANYVGFLAGIGATLRAAVKWINPKSNIEPVDYSIAEAKSNIEPVDYSIAEAKVGIGTADYSIAEAKVGIGTADYSIAEAKVASTKSITQIMAEAKAGALAAGALKAGLRKSAIDEISYDNIEIVKYEARKIDSTYSPNVTQTIAEFNSLAVPFAQPYETWYMLLAARKNNVQPSIFVGVKNFVHSNIVPNLVFGTGYVADSESGKAFFHAGVYEANFGAVEVVGQSYGRNFYGWTFAKPSFKVTQNLATLGSIGTRKAEFGEPAKVTQLQFLATSQNGEQAAVNYVNSYQAAELRAITYDFNSATALAIAKTEFYYRSAQASTFVRQVFNYNPHYVVRDIKNTEYIASLRDKTVYSEQEFKKQSYPSSSGKMIEFLNNLPANILLHDGLSWTSVQVPAHTGVKQAFDKVAIPAYPGVRQSWERIITNAYPGVRQSWERIITNAYPGVIQTFSSVKYNVHSVQQGWAVRLYNSTLIQVSYDIAKANVEIHGLKPILYQAGKNNIDKAKYYMGFTTQAEVLEFVKAFLKPSIQQKLDGYVYRVGTDDTLICEVRGPNMPVAWLMRGG